jgi:hypothetical protein
VAGGWVVNLPPAASTAFLQTMQPEPRTRLIDQSGANGSLSTMVPE